MDDPAPLLLPSDTEPDDLLEEVRRYERYEENYNPERHYRKPRKSVLAPIPVPVPAAAETPDAGWTYKAGRHEKIWLEGSLQSFFHTRKIDDVLSTVRGGKEASVYRCRAGAEEGGGIVAAKVYRPRGMRNLRNDAMYREGRPLLDRRGDAVGPRDTRTLKAAAQKTRFGAEVTHVSWLMYEYSTLQQLHAAGAAVPKPIAFAENAILMEFIGDELTAAPALNQIELDPGEAEALFHETLRNVELLLRAGRVHGDLSAYNILYWGGRITLIDFPQVTDCAGNRNAEFIFRRDILRVCEYLAGQGVDSDPEALAGELWRRHGLPF